MDEQEMIELLRQHDQRGMEYLIRHYTPLLRYVITPILPDCRDREECLSEIAMRVWEKIGLYTWDRGSWTGWLTALARNAALNRLRQSRSRDGEEPPDHSMPSPEPSPEEQLLRQERQEALRRAVDRLPDRDRTLIYRRYYYLQPVSQIAAELGTTERAIEGRLYRLRRKLKNVLGGEGHD